jgi:membrane protease YdiL (CAAX protease family)/tetratricopeptide (TPR) repeat protein
MSEQIFLIIDGQSKGPFAPKQIRDGLKSGTITPQSLAALRGSDQWKPVAEVLQDLSAGGATAPSATERLLASLAQRLEEQDALDRLGLSGDPSPMVIEKTYDRLKAQLQERLGGASNDNCRQLAKEVHALLRDAVSQLQDPKERFILRRAADLGVDARKDENRSYLSSLYHRDEGQAAFDGDRMSEALRHFDALLEIQPDSADAVWQRALALYRCDPLRTQEALSELRRCASTWPDKVEPVRSLAELHLELGRRDEARSLALEALALKPGDPEIKHLIDVISGKKGASDVPRKASSKSNEKGEFGKAAKQGKAKKKAKSGGGPTASSDDKFGLVKVLGVCAIVFGLLFQMAHKSPETCFPQGDQEYFFQPDTYYDFRDPGGEELPGDLCAPSLHPPEGSGYFIQLETQLSCSEELEMDNPSVSKEKLDAECAYIPIASPNHERSADANFFYTRRFILLGVGLICILLLGSGESVLERIKNVGFEVEGTLGAAVAFGLIVGFFSPLQFTMAPLVSLLALTAFHVICEEVFFRGFVTRKLLDSFASPLAPVVLSGLLFGVYHITFTSFWWITPMAIPAWIGMVTIGAGIPYAALYAKSGSILVPLTCHLVVNLLMMFRSHGAVAAMIGG